MGIRGTIRIQGSKGEEKAAGHEAPSGNGLKRGATTGEFGLQEADGEENGDSGEKKNWTNCLHGKSRPFGAQATWALPGFPRRSPR